jgi:multidrug efflux pump subunit AcrA (membrane-fusion protein)
MFATVNIETASLKDRILIPKDALLVRDRRNLVFAVEDTLAKWKYVDIGEQNDDYIEVLRGISPGEEVIIEGHYTLAHDAKINVIRNTD